MIKTVEIQKRASKAALAGLLAVSLCGGTMLGGVPIVLSTDFSIDFPLAWQC